MTSSHESLEDAKTSLTLTRRTPKTWNPHQNARRMNLRLQFRRSTQPLAIPPIFPFRLRPSLLLSLRDAGLTRMWLILPPGACSRKIWSGYKRVQRMLEVSLRFYSLWNAPLRDFQELKASNLSLSFFFFLIQLKTPRKSGPANHHLILTSKQMH